MRSGLIGSASAVLTALHLAAAPAAPPASSPEPPALPIAGEFTQDPPPAPANQPAAPATRPAPATQPAVPPAAGPVQAPPTAAAPCGPVQVPKFRDCHVGPPWQVWLGGGYLFLWITDAPQPNALGVSGASVLGGTDIDYGTFSGLTLNGGMWLNDRHTVGTYLGGFITEQRSVSAALASDAAGVPVITRPVIDALNVVPADVIVAAPGALAGGVAFSSRSRLAGAEAGIIRNLLHDCGCTVDTFFGFRYLDLDEDLVVTQTTQALANGQIFFGGAPVAGPGAGLVIEDRFDTRNQIYAGQIGTRGEYRRGPMFVAARSAVSLGPNHQVIEIAGRTAAVGAATAALPGGGVLPGGLLALQGGNAGRFTENRFVYVPEVGVQVGLQATRHLRLLVGYDYLYINDVARPGSQIDPSVSPRLVPASPVFGATSGQAAPRYLARSDEFHVHGLRFGMEVRY
jgi:hypothetical protein